jgi:hypothetical protein
MSSIAMSCPGVWTVFFVSRSDPHVKPPEKPIIAATATKRNSVVFMIPPSPLKLIDDALTG